MGVGGGGGACMAEAFCVGMGELLSVSFAGHLMERHKALQGSPTCSKML